MQATRILIGLIVYGATMLESGAGTALDSRTEELIDQLPQISQIGYGYSAMFSGSQFLPEPETSQVSTLVLGSQAPTNSVVLESIVRRGITAVPSLLKHLDDARETKIPPISAMMWVSYADEYDYNHRLIKEGPAGVNKEDTFGENQPRQHTITVGDLCFVAFGQIVNRNFNATRYQPSGGLIVSSPTSSPQLCTVIRADFTGLTEKKHRDLLTQDILLPDSGERREGACRRMAFYYPDTLEPLVLKQLLVPTYDVFKIEDFVRGNLYPYKSKTNRQAMFRKFVSDNGTAFSDGVLLQLFGDLFTQEADEQHRLFPPLKQKYDARALLVQLYGYANTINSTNKPYVTTWDGSDLARFIKSFGNYPSRKVDERVHEIFAKVTDDDYLALACMQRLIHKGYNEEMRYFCERRIPQSKYYADELRKMLEKIESSNPDHHP